MVDWGGLEPIEVEANGLTFEVYARGHGDRLALCLHGFPEHAVSWRHQAPLLAGLGYRVWMPNLRGYGNTDAPQGLDAYALEVLVEDVAGLIRASGAREVVLLGHDWGGMLAWLLAIRRPELITRLIICNLPHPACFLRELKKPHQALKSWYVLFFQIPWLPERLLGRRGAAAIAGMIQSTLQRPGAIPPEVLDVYRRNAARPGRLTAMLAWYHAFLRGGGVARLRAAGFPVIRTPTLLLWGMEDTALSVTTTRGTEAYVEDLTLRLLPGISHWLQQEAAAEVNAMIEAWLLDRPVPFAGNNPA